MVVEDPTGAIDALGGEPNLGIGRVEGLKNHHFSAWSYSLEPGQPATPGVFVDDRSNGVRRHGLGGINHDDIAVMELREHRLPRHPKRYGVRRGPFIFNVRVGPSRGPAFGLGGI